MKQTPEYKYPDYPGGYIFYYLHLSIENGNKEEVEKIKKYISENKLRIDVHKIEEAPFLHSEALENLKNEHKEKLKNKIDENKDSIYVHYDILGKEFIDKRDIKTWEIHGFTINQCVCKSCGKFEIFSFCFNLVNTKRFPLKEFRISHHDYSKEKLKALENFFREIGEDGIEKHAYYRLTDIKKHE